MFTLNKHFDHIYCINLDRRKDRWALAYEEFLVWSIEAERVSAIDGNSLGHAMWMSNGAEALVRTNIAILKDAKEKGYKRILILEDDVVFSQEIKNIGTYMDTLPPDWDMLWFAGNHNTHVIGEVPPKRINDKVLKVHNTYSTHCVGIRASMYNTIINRLEKLDKPLDVCYAELQKAHNVYCFSAHVAMVTQRSGFSDIELKETEYGWLIK